MNTDNAIAIVLARAGSKGLPGKNSMLLAGKPCAQWTIELALSSNSIRQVVVSSDDEQVKNGAQNLGCTVIDRPEELAHDTATIDNAARHAFESIGSPDVPIVILYANVPVRPDSLIDDAVSMLCDSKCDSVQSYTQVGKHHPWWTVRVDESGEVQPWEGDVLYHNCFRRQDLPSALIPDGGVVALTPDALMCRVDAPSGPHCFLGNDRRGIITREGEVIDIDSRIDQIVAETILNEQMRERVVHADR
ncbi:MAG: acylneuraminate cytidylyltransferase family protein [Phycisphaerales bacterium]|nr:acylneuraminate cytidylyltransferase family protein [Phycisphaerales bacterium]